MGKVNTEGNCGETGCGEGDDGADVAGEGERRWVR